MNLSCVQLNLEKLGNLKQQVFLAGLKPDLALFQDFWQKESLKVPDTRGIITNACRKDGFGVGSAVFYRESALSKRTTVPHVTTDREMWPVCTKKSSTFIEFETKTGGVLLVASFHGIKDWLFSRVRPLESQLTDLLETFAKWPPGRPAIICGDFSTTTKARTEMVKSLMAAHGFRQSYTAKTASGQNLDWVFARGCDLGGFSAKSGLSSHPALMFNIEI